MTSVDVLTPEGTKKGTVDLPDELFDVQVNVPLIHQVVVAQLAAARQGTADTKTRAEVRGGGKKPYKQKGTGRARQGSTRAPQFAGGGVVYAGSDDGTIYALTANDNIGSGNNDRISSFIAVNAGKQSIALDLKSPQDLQIAKDIVARCDVLLENFRPGTMDRLGLGYATLAKRNAKLIYCAISGYGQTGPMRHKGGFDLVAQGVSGIMSVTGEPGGAPVKSGIPVTDLGAALFALVGILAALRHRDCFCRVLRLHGGCLRVVVVRAGSRAPAIPRRAGCRSPARAPARRSPP